MRDEKAERATKKHGVQKLWPYYFLDTTQLICAADSASV